MDIKLSEDEALILHDILYRISTNEEIFPDIADRKVLWTLEAQLDKALIEPFMPNYDELVEAAKNRIRNGNE